MNPPHKIAAFGLVFCLSLLFLPGPAKAEKGPDAYRDIVWNYLVRLTGFGPRPPGSEGHRKTQDLIRQIGEQYADQVTDQAFEVSTSSGEVLPLTNWTLKFNTQAKGPALWIGAHYDTRPFADEEFNPALHRTPILGANDGGSGTALLMGLAHYLKKHPPKRPVHLIFFDGEDYGAKGSSDKLLGSIHYANELEKAGPEAWPIGLIVVDMVGDRDLKIHKEVHSLKSGRWLVELLFEEAERQKLTAFQDSVKYKIFDDHFPFIRLGIASVVLIDFDYPYWHTLEDTLDKCSPESLAAVFSVLANALGQI